MWFSSTMLLFVLNASRYYPFNHSSWSFFFKKCLICLYSQNQLLFGDGLTEIGFSCWWLDAEKFVASSGCHFVLFTEGMIVITFHFISFHFTLQLILLFNTIFGSSVFYSPLNTRHVTIIWFSILYCSRCQCSSLQIKLASTCWKQL